MQAANIYTDLITNKPLRDEFLPNSSLSNLLKLHQILMKSDQLSPEERAKLAAEYARQYIEDIASIEPRLTAVVQVGAKPPQGQIHIPGAVMSVRDAEKTTHFLARNPQEYQLDPINFGITIEDTPAKGLLDAIDKGLPFKVAAGQILQLHTSSPLFQRHFAETDLTAIQLEVNPIVPPAIASKEVPVRLVAGVEPTTKEIPYVTLRVKRIGKREMVLVSNRTVPAEITITIHLGDPSFTFSIQPTLQGAEVKAAYQLIEFLDELQKSGEFKVFSLEFGTPLGEIMGSFSNTLNITADLKAIIRDAAIVARFVKKNLHLPDRLLESDAENLLLLKRMATGEEFSGIEINAVLSRNLATEQTLLAATASQPLRFEQVVSDQAFTVFNEELRPPTMVFEAQNVTFKNLDETRKAFRSAAEESKLSCVLCCAGPCRFVPISTEGPKS